jgi:hypothetical protein
MIVDELCSDCFGFGGGPVDERLSEGAERDQLWASLRALVPEVDRLAAGEWQGTDRERQLVRVLAGVVAAELRFRAIGGD